MNYLAHVFLASQSQPAMIGALLGDFVKANVTGIYTPEIEAEIMLHRKIDTYTDAHPVNKRAKLSIAESRRRYAGILLDIFYDHILAKNWSLYSATPLADFIQHFYDGLVVHKELLPENLAQAAPRMIEQDWLGSYLDFSGIEVAVVRTSTRLSRNGHLLREGLEDLRENYDTVAACFLEFFPELIQFVADYRKNLST